MPVSFNHNFCFVHIPKTGGTSIRKALIELDPKVNHWSYHTYIRSYYNVLNKRTFAKLFKFAFVRNPWDRVVSYYTWLRSKEHKRIDYCIWQDMMETPFVDFIHTMMPQMNYIKLDGEIAVDYVGKMETFERSLAEISEIIGISIPVYHERCTDHMHYAQYYDSKTRGIVSKMFEEEIDTFGYAFSETELKFISHPVVLKSRFPLLHL